jgi:hypothetical protein
MITARSKVIVDSLKDSLSIVTNLGSLSMHQHGRGYDLAAKGLPNRLMAQANSQNGYFSRERFDYFK